MKITFLTLLLSLGFLYESRSQQWELQKFIDSGVTSSNAIARDEAGNLYITGFFSDTLSFNNQQYISQGSYDGFILSIDETGGPRWIKVVGGSDVESITELEYRDGVLYLGGTYKSASLNLQISTLQNNSPGTSECFVSAMDTLGNFLWARSYGSSNTSEVQLSDLHITQDAVFVAGAFQGIFDGGNGILASSSGGYDTYLLKLDLSGTSSWGRFGYGVGEDFLSAVTTDVNGNIYCAGAFGNLSGLGNASIFIGSIQLTAVGGFGFYDMFIVRYDSTGTLQYALREGGTNYDIPRTILLDGNKVLIGGSYYFSTVLNGVSYNTNGGNEGFLFCTDTTLLPQWSQIFTTTAGATSYYDDVIYDIDQQGPNQYFVLNMVYAYGLKISLVNGSGTILNTETLQTQHNSTYESGMLSDGSCGKLYITGSFTDSLKSNTDTITGGYADAFIAMRTDSSTLLSSPQNLSGTAPDTICADYPLFSISVDPVVGALSYGWQIIPQQAGTVTGTTNLATININDSYSGTVSIICYAASACNTSAPSDTLHYQINQIPLTPTIIVSGLLLTSSITANNYTWYYNGNALPNDTSINLLATANGIYQLAINNDGCNSALSPQVFITNVGLNENSASTFQLYPNPASSQISITGSFKGNEHYKIRSCEGRTIQQRSLTPTNSIDVSSLQNGCYLIELYQQETLIYCEKFSVLR
jgi:hypothetical protein